MIELVISPADRDTTREIACHDVACRPGYRLDPAQEAAADHHTPAEREHQRDRRTPAEGAQDQLVHLGALLRIDGENQTRAARQFQIAPAEGESVIAVLIGARERQIEPAPEARRGRQVAGNDFSVGIFEQVVHRTFRALPNALPDQGGEGRDAPGADGAIELG